jgi:hypothetical protein
MGPAIGQAPVRTKATKDGLAEAGSELTDAAAQSGHMPLIAARALIDKVG